METRYPSGTVMALLGTEFMTALTTRVLEQRTEFAKSAKPLFFMPADFEVLSIVCDLLMAQDSANRIVNCALFIDERLSKNNCDGWRYNSMPNDKNMFIKGIQGIEELAHQLFASRFIDLDKKLQLQILTSLKNATASGKVWEEMPPQTFFEELLAETTEIFYSYPLVQEEMGYVGMAEAKGWPKIGLNERHEIEPEPIKTL